MNRSMPGLPVHHQLLESTQTHVHWVGDAIQPSHPLSSPSQHTSKSWLDPWPMQLSVPLVVFRLPPLLAEEKSVSGKDVTACQAKISWLRESQCHRGYQNPKVTLLFNHSVMSNSLWPHGLQHARLPCPSPSPGVCSGSCPLSRWCYLTISSCILESQGDLELIFMGSWYSPSLIMCIPTSSSQLAVTHLFSFCEGTFDEWSELACMDPLALASCPQESPPLSAAAAPRGFCWQSSVGFWAPE